MYTDKFRLFQLSLLTLFVELTLIRWTGSHLFFLAFFSNFVLLASFLGIGLGFLRAESAKNLFPYSPIVLALFIWLCQQNQYQYVAELNPTTNDLNYFTTFFKNKLFPIWLSLPIIFLCVTGVMATLSDGTARTFRRLPALQAYRFDVLGALIGVILFSLLSFFYTAPWWWGIVISTLFISLFISEWRKKPLLALLQITALVFLTWSFAKTTHTHASLWSPYYKINVQAFAKERYVITVNGVPQQTIEPIALRKETKPFYFSPYQHLLPHHALEHVLVIGSGTGGDVAIALAQGAKHVDAVEIDPLLYKLGKHFHPNHPYQDPRVQVFINDGRAFLQQSTQLYDMIIFALPDSIMLIPGQSSLRLENYLYTLEGINMVKNHLKPSGVFTIYNYYHLPWVLDRLANTLTQVFTHTPCIDTHGLRQDLLSVLTISPNPALPCATTWQPTHAAYATPATDNHPFLFLKENRLSWLYGIALLFIVSTTLYAIKIAGKSPRIIKNHLDLFLMGAAFLLLETKSVIQFALLFGSTWLVNALVFTGVLFTVYFATEIVNRYPRKHLLATYLLLLVALLCAFITPNSFLLSLSVLPRFLIATTLTFAPIFLATLIFTERFCDASNPAEAFGANLIGAILGGLLEYAAVITGYHVLLFLIALLYTLAIIATLRRTAAKAVT